MQEIRELEFFIYQSPEYHPYRGGSYFPSEIEGMQELHYVSGSPILLQNFFNVFKLFHFFYNRIPHVDLNEDEPSGFCVIVAKNVVASPSFIPELDSGKVRYCYAIFKPSLYK